MTESIREAAEVDRKVISRPQLQHSVGVSFVTYVDYKCVGPGGSRADIIPWFSADSVALSPVQA